MSPTEERPVLDLPMSQTDRFIESVAAFALIVMIAIPVIYWQALPDKIATHFGASGKPDAWGSKSTILMLPVIGFLSYFLLTILNRYPHIFNYPAPITPENAERQYRLGQRIIRLVKAGTTLLFAYIEWGTVQVALGRAQGLSPLLTPIIILASIALVVYTFVALHRAK